MWWGVLGCRLCYEMCWAVGCVVWWVVGCVVGCGGM